MTNEVVTLKGAIDVKLFDLEGRLIQHMAKSNVVVTVGKNYLATPGNGLGDFLEIACGTGSTPASASDTALVAEAFRKAGSLSSALNVFQNTTTFLPGDGTGLIQEIGLFAGSTLLARQTITAFNKTGSNSMIVTWQITIS
ncbi:MAG: hypothetical protein AB7V39_00520 [Nitrospiraceae bacterium]